MIKVNELQFSFPFFFSGQFRGDNRKHDVWAATGVWSAQRPINQRKSNAIRPINEETLRGHGALTANSAALLSWHFLGRAPHCQTATPIHARSSWVRQVELPL